MNYDNDHGFKINVTIVGMEMDQHFKLAVAQHKHFVNY